MAGFTEGPWFASKDGNIWRRSPSELSENGGDVAGDYPIASASRGALHWEDEYPHIANAHLIAAAPDMYKALEDVLAAVSGGEKSCGHNFTCICPGDSARAALAKARGEQL